MYRFIMNPIAGNGIAKNIFSKIKRTELYQKIESTCYVTQYSGHAEEMAKQIAEGSGETTCVIVIGGDGTLHEAINGLCPHHVPVAFIPGGSGNDFARGCGIKGDPLTIFEQIIAGENKIAYWLGRYQINHEQERLFVNNIGFGFDAQITDTANRSRYKKLFNKLRLGSLSYVIAIIQVLFRFKPMTIDLQVNGVLKQVTNCWMVTIANHPYYGGGMKIIPHAKIQPSTFPVLLIHSISKWKVLALFLTVFTGKHVNFKEVELVDAQQFKIVAESEIAYQVDGQTSKCLSCTLSKQQQSIIINNGVQWKEKDRQAQMTR